MDTRQMEKVRTIMDRRGIEVALRKMALEILQKHQTLDDLAIVGIHRRGVPLADRLLGILREMEPKEVPMGKIDITLYRDDVSMGHPHPLLGETDLPFKVTGSTIILVDDVLFTGRTVRAAMDALVDFGRPQRIQLAALVDRGHRELPIQPQYVGETVDTMVDQRVRVLLDEVDGEDEVVLYQVKEG